MRRTLTSALPETAPGEDVRLQGWVHRRRELARITFLVVRDRSGLAQVVLPAGAELPPEETPIEVRGIATPNPQAPGGVEVTGATVAALS
jgi:nondiscriminating aspartyl-tRNA synthetase